MVLTGMELPSFPTKGLPVFQDFFIRNPETKLGMPLNNPTVDFDTLFG